MEIIASISIIGLVIIIVTKEIVAHLERLQMEKLRKANSVNEVMALTEEPTEDNPILEDNNLVDLADMPDLPFQDKKVEGE